MVPLVEADIIMVVMEVVKAVAVGMVVEPQTWLAEEVVVQGILELC